MIRMVFKKNLKRLRKRIHQVGLLNAFRLARRKNNKHINVTSKVVRYIDDLTAKTFDENLINLWKETEGLPQSNMQIDLTEAAFLRFIVRLSKATRILEIGTFRGWSTAIFASAIMQNEIKVFGPGSASGPEAHGRVVTLERDQEQARTAKVLWDRNLDVVTESRIDLRIGDAKESLKDLVSTESYFDLIFIDADKGGYPLYLEKAKKLIVPGGLIVLDNMLNAGLVAHGAKDRVTSSIQEATQNVFTDSSMAEGLEPLFIPAWDGLVILRAK